MTVNGDAHFSAADLRQHLDLLQDDHVPDGSDELRDAPILTEPVRRHALSLPANPIGQYGLLGVNREAMAGGSIDRDSFLASGGNGPQLYQNITAPWSAFICGSQGSGKSHTLSCTLENCLAQSSANVLPRPLTGIVFHYDHLSSDVGGTACEAAYLSSNPKIKVRVLCPPTNIRQIQVSSPL